jgi:hypothetical protein
MRQIKTGSIFKKSGNYINLYKEKKGRKEMENKPKPVQQPGQKKKPQSVENPWTKPLLENEQLKKLLLRINDEQKDK